MNKIHVLLLGKEDWTKKYQIPDFIEWEWFDKEKKQPEGLMDLVILDRNINVSEDQLLRKITRGHCLFATEHVKMKYVSTRRFFEGKMGQYLYTGDVQAFLDTEAKNYYPNPYGEKFSPAFLEVNPMFEGEAVLKGNYDMQLSGNFGNEFTQIVYWKNNVPVFKDQTIDLYLEYNKTGTVEIQLNVWQFWNGSVGDIQQKWTFHEEELQNIVRIANKMEYGPIFISLLAKGEGTLNIISLHDRYSRENHGFFLPGGERLISSKGEEAFAYFEKCDGKPPLAVYFSGYRKQEGFEGYYMMRNLGCPFLLITDPRLEGGAFYVGDEEFENLILNVIYEKIKLLGFTEKDVILSGASMGTFGSLYYGTRLHPHALLLAKPLANMGNVAKNERINRVGIFPTSLDVLLKNYDSLDEKAIEEFNHRFWSRFDAADWTKTKFIMSYLYEDDYDSDAYQDILSHLKSDGVEVYGKGTHGRHNDNTATVMAWFKSQYQKLLEEDFHRKK